jgi:A/G-specific adenine glycosylase
MKNLVRPFSGNEAPGLVPSLLAWFRLNKRPFPWRRSYHPYEVWISEVMLQQTRAERGVEYFLRWMRRFPDVASVAAASEDDILHAWEGLGYYRRARCLHAAARLIQERHQGNVPSGADELSALPGLGAYTVAAVRGIAFGQDVAAVDANVDRIFCRLLNLDLPPGNREAARRIREQAQLLLPPGQAREYNEALMELGALLCGKTPRCGLCPLPAHCVSRRLGLERERPVRKEKEPVFPVLAGYGVLVEQGRTLLCRRPVSGLWGGLWEFPGGEAAAGENPARAARRVFAERLGIAVRVETMLCTLQHSYTNHRLTAHFFRVSRDGRGEAPFSPAPLPNSQMLLADGRQVRELGMPAHHRKLADRYFSGGYLDEIPEEAEGKSLRKKKPAFS